MSESENGSKPNGLASLEQLFGTVRRRYKEIDLPVSGLRVRIQSLTERELSAYEASFASAQAGRVSRSRIEDANRRMIGLCMVDGAGHRMLSDSHVDQLGDWDSADARFLAEECSEFVGMKRGEIEDLAKNSVETHAGG